MMPVSTEIHAGVCGFVTRIEATPQPDETIRVQIDTDCEKIKALALKIGPSLDPIHEIHMGHEGNVLTAARATLSGCCSGCVVPPGIFKTTQVAGRLALPRDISMVIKDTTP